MTQDPKVTVGWALNGLEQAIRELRTGSTEGRVRNQFHQLMLAIERDTVSADVQRIRFDGLDMNGPRSPIDSIGRETEAEPPPFH